MKASEGSTLTAEAEPDFKALFEAVSGLYLVLTPDFRIVAATNSYLRATKTVRKQIIGQLLFDVFPDNPDDPDASEVRDLVRASLKRVLQNKTPDTVAVQRTDTRRPESEDGVAEQRYWRSVNSPVAGKDGNVEYVIHRVEDVKIEEPVRDREELLKTFVRYVPAAVAMFDRQMRYLQVSDRWCADFSLGSDEILGRSHYEVFPDVPERWREIHRRCLAGETLRADEDCWERAEGSPTWLRWEMQPWGERREAGGRGDFLGRHHRAQTDRGHAAGE